MRTEPRDEDLVHLAQGGDRDALVRLYRRYVGEICTYLRHQTGDLADAEDIASETFLRVVQSLDGFRGQSSFRTWIYAVARNQLRDHWRRNGRRPRTTELDESRFDASVGRAVDAEEAAAAVNARATALGRAVMAELPPNYRQVIQLRILEGRSIRDTADELGLTVSNVKVLQHRGLKTAAKIVEGLTDDPDDAADGSRRPPGESAQGESGRSVEQSDGE